MKIRPRCGICLLHRGWKEIQLATDDPILQFRALKAVIAFLAKEFDKDAISAELGTKRDRIIRDLTNCPDPYKDHKIKSNEIALKLAPILESTLEVETDPYKRFRYTILIAIVGNIVEFDIVEHNMDLTKPEFLQVLISKAEQDLAIDNIERIYQLVRKRKEVLFLTDNAGEIVFDKYLILELLALGAQVTVAVKETPALNDATMEDAEIAGLV